MSSVAFNGRDLVVKFDENPLNGAETKYQIDYICADETVTHYVGEEHFQGVDPDTGMHMYQDVLTYEENRAAGLTRTPTVRLRTMNASGAWSAWLEVDAQNTAPVFSLPPTIISTTVGVEVKVVEPQHLDLVGYIAWVGDTPDFPLDDAHQRYRGAADSFIITLGDYYKHYIRIAPYDSFGIDTSSAWSAQVAERSYNENTTATKLSNALQRSIDDDLQNALRGIITNDLNNLSDTNSMNERFGTLDAQIGDIVDGAFTEVQERVDVLESSVAGNTGRITTEETTRAGETAALAGRATTLEGRLNNVNGTGATVEATFTNVTTTIATNNTAQTNNYNSLVSRLNGFNGTGSTIESSFTSLTTTVANNNSTQTTNYNNLTSRFNLFNGTGGTIEAAINGMNSTIATNNSAQTSNYNTLTARLNNFGGTSGLTIESRITTLNTAISDEVSARASAITAVQTDYNGQFGGVSTSLSSLSTRAGVIENTYTVKLDSNGRGVGFSMINGTNTTSQAVFVMDNFSIVKPGGGARIEFANGAWKIWDSGGALRVQLGNLDA